MKLEYLILTTSGPFAGEATIPDTEAACDALDAGVREAFGAAFTDDHLTAVRQIATQMRTTEPPFSYRTAAVSVTLSP